MAKDLTFIRRIEEARRRLEGLSDLCKDPFQSETEIRQTVAELSGVLDEVKTLLSDAKRGAGCENEIAFHVLAEVAPDAIISIDDQSTIQYVNPAAG